MKSIIIKLSFIFFLTNNILYSQTVLATRADSIAEMLRHTPKIKIPMSIALKKLNKCKYPLPSLFMEYLINEGHPYMNEDISIANSKSVDYFSCYYFKYKNKTFWIVNAKLKSTELDVIFPRLIVLDSMNSKIAVSSDISGSIIDFKRKFSCFFRDNKLFFKMEGVKNDVWYFDEDLNSLEGYVENKPIKFDD